MTCLAEEESSSERDAEIVIVGSCSVLLSESVASVEVAAKEAFENKINPLMDKSGIIFFASDV